MLASINPLGERARNRQWSRTVAAYLVGSVLGGAAFGALLGLAGDLAGVKAGSATAAAVVIAMCALGLLVDLGLGGMKLPTVRRQVDKDWLDRYRGWVYGLSFGFQLGLGVVTVVNTSAIYLTFVLALVSGSGVLGAVIGAAFGLARGLVILSVRTVRQPDELRRAHRRMQSWAPGSRHVSLGVQAATGLGIAAMVIAG